MRDHAPPLTRRRALGLGLCAAAAATTGIGVRAQAAWPERSVRLVVPFPAGGATDFMARSLAEPLSVRLGQTVIADNRSGAGGSLGAETVARAPADGYTLLFATMGSLTINPSLYRNLRYKPQEDFDPIVLTHSTSNLLVVHPEVQARSVAELIALAKKQPGELTFASAGNGTTSHLSGELFKSLAGVDIRHIPYKGSAPAMTDFLAGRISMMFDTTSNFVSYVAEQRVRALGTTGAKASGALPDVPPIAATPGMENYEVSLWLGVLAPHGTPPDVRRRIEAAVREVMSTPSMAQTMGKAGIDIRLEGEQAFASLIHSDPAKWASVIQQAGIQLG